MKTNTKTYARLRQAARDIASEYIEVIERDAMPARLHTWIPERRQMILADVADKRYADETILAETAKVARKYIEERLRAHPELAESLDRMRKEYAAELSERSRRRIKAKADALLRQREAARNAAPHPSADELRAAVATLKRAAAAVDTLPGFSPFIGKDMVKALFTDAGNYAGLMQVMIEADQ